MFHIPMITILTDLPIIIGLLYVLMQTYKRKAAELVEEVEKSAVMDRK